MYTPNAFAESRIDVLHTLIEQHSLGTLVMHGADGLVADHIPFEIAPPSEHAPFGILRAHVARANRLWRNSGAPAMVVFQGASAYISPSLYEEKQISGKVVPTYNYAAVHAHGTLRSIEDPAWLMALLERLTARHESARAAPWSVHDAPPDYLAQMLNAIVGIEIVLERLDGKWKLSQNRSRADRRSITNGLAGIDASPSVAAMMAASLGD